MGERAPMASAATPADGLNVLSTVFSCHWALYDQSNLSLYAYGAEQPPLQAQGSMQGRANWAVLLGRESSLRHLIRVLSFFATR